MPVNKIGLFLSEYRSRKKEEAEQERLRRIEDARRAPKIVDPSFELFARQAPQEYAYEDFLNQQRNKPSPPTPSNDTDDWLFQNRRASTMPQPYQFEPYCEVTPKSSVSSSTSTCSGPKPVTDYDMGWDAANVTRPRPQSCLPSIAKINTMSMSDLHRASAYRSRRQNSQPENLAVQTVVKPMTVQSSYGMGASLTKPFSISDPWEAFAGGESQCTSPVQPSDTAWDAKFPSIQQGGDSTPRPPQ